MSLPFTTDDFFYVFARYNEAVWPIQIVLMALGGAAALLIATRWRFAGAAIAGVLAFLWSWTAIAYHALFFAKINPLAWGFVLVSLAGAGAFLWFGVMRRQLVFGGVVLWRAIAGSLLIGFSLAVYPVWSYQAGHPYPFLPSFGLPCPTTLFTIGVLAFMERPYPMSILLVPVFWSLVGSVAAFELDVPQDLSLLVAGAIGIVLLAKSHPAAGPDGR